MRSLPYNFARQKNLQENAIIDLVMLETGAAYVSRIEAAESDKKSVRISTQLTSLFSELSISPYGEGDGYCWVATFESGRNVGTSRVITDYTTNSGYGRLHFDEPLVFTSVYTEREIDCIRISYNVLLAKWHENISFFLPDNSTTQTDHALVFVPFPMSIEPIGTNITGEVLNMKVDVSNVSRYIGDLVQQADGLRGNRVIFLRTFDGVYQYGRIYCLKDIMYIDSVGIDNTTVNFALESRFNIVGLNLPNGVYNRNFCRHIFKDDRCGWTTETGLDTNYKYANKNSTENPSFKIGELQCDHSLMGPNGCVAHRNSRRFGGFPSIPAKQ